MTENIEFDVWDGLVHLQRIESLHALTSKAILSMPSDDHVLMTEAGYFENDVGGARQRNFVKSLFQEADLLQRIEAQSFLAISFGVFEHTLTKICQNYLTASGAELRWRDFYGGSLDKAKSIAARFGGASAPFEGNLWEVINAAQKIRHKIIHAGGLVSDGDKEIWKAIEVLKGVSLVKFSDGSGLKEICIEPNAVRYLSTLYKEFLEKLHNDLDERLAA